MGVWTGCYLRTEGWTANLAYVANKEFAVVSVQCLEGSMRYFVW